MVAAFQRRPLGLNRGIEQIAISEGFWRSDFTTRDGVTYNGFYQNLYDQHGKPLVVNGKPIRSFKNSVKGDDQPHDLWANKPKGFKPLILPRSGIIKAIAANSGHLNSTEGKADTLSMWASGRENTIGYFGTSFIPDDLAAQLTQWGVKSFTHYAHPDKAGIDAAQRIVNLLANTTIRVVIFLLPTVDGKKRDVNDLWQLAECNPATFQAYLADLDQLRLTPEPIRIFEKRTAAPIAFINRRVEGYWNSALNGECAKVASAAPGDANNQLYRSTAAIGSIIGAGVGSITEAESAFISAYLARNKGEREARATIASGLEDGMLSPRDLSKLNEQPVPDRRNEHAPMKIVDNIHDYVQAVPHRWGKDIPATFIRLYLLHGAYRRGSGNGRAEDIAVLRQIYRAFGYTPFTIKQASNATGLTVQKISTVITQEFRLGGCFKVLASIYANQEEQNTDNADQTLKMPSASKGKAYQLLDHEGCTDLIYQRAAAFLMDDKRMRHVTVTRVQSLDPKCDEEQVLDINERLDAALSEIELQAERKKRNEVESALRLILAQLDDLTPTDLPLTDNGNDLKGAMSVRYAEQHLGKAPGSSHAERTTGLPISTQKRYERQNGYKRVKQPTLFEDIETPKSLPQPEVYATDKGYPFRAIVYTKTQTVRFTYSIENMVKIREMFNQDGTTAVLTYNPPSIIEKMTDQEIADQGQRKAEKPTEKTDESSKTKRNEAKPRPQQFDIPQWVKDFFAIPALAPKTDRPLHLHSGRELVRLMLGHNLTSIQSEPNKTLHFADIPTTIPVENSAPADDFQPIVSRPYSLTSEEARRGVDLLIQYDTFTDSNDRDDFYIGLSGKDKELLIAVRVA